MVGEWGLWQELDMQATPTTKSLPKADFPHLPQPSTYTAPNLSSFFSVPMFLVPGHMGNEEPLSQMGTLES